METTENPTVKNEFLGIITSSALLEHWQGHRRLTRRMIEAFPEYEFFHYSIGGMRPFAGMVWEFLGIAKPGLRGALSGDWSAISEQLHHSGAAIPTTKTEVLKLWDELTDEINVVWPQIPDSRFQETDLAYGAYEGQVYAFMLYWIDNEIHHRGQASVYLRALGIEPPYFWER